MNMPNIRAIRRIYAIFFFGLFLWLLWILDPQHMKGYETGLILELSPLTAIAGFFTSGTVYLGLAWALPIIFLTLFFGRFFCSWICPLGILNQFSSWLFNRRRPVDQYKNNAYRPIFRLKYYILAGLLILSAFGALQIGLLDPIALLTRSFTVSLYPAINQWGVGPYLNQPIFLGGALISALLIVLILANRFITRYWCRVLCPLGALLGVMSLRAPFRIRRDVDKCTDCNKCLANCQGGCDPHAEHRVSECHACMNCIEDCPEGALHYGLPESRTSAAKPFDINRRRLGEVAVASVVFYPMLKSAVSASTKPQHQTIRPPGSLPEEEFNARCIKCAACMRVCPTNVLQPALLGAGFEGLWTPILVNKIGWCEHHCVLCGQACPTGAIQRISVQEKVGEKPFEKPVKLGTAFFDHGRCLPWSMHTECVVCEEVCPTTPKAIWYKRVELLKRDGSVVKLKQPYMAPDLCIGCGICENKCPVEDYAAVRITSVGETRSKANQMLLKGKS
ncbi:4Fe-4S binding protein [Magnetofaba australis]|uniref:Putative 4Fe-4S ferredoxin n=1 Tax=Magnetofaba australis IT-1 TaxID=1434232 RepID=A0A1Y2K5B3_9PROT|nr:4Fe-4S binding protein [Magnetofaba australis]OSM04426.1 putative 4Fe-4S ferredoxin [Magnetofaba australis IT-1]